MKISICYEKLANENRRLSTLYIILIIFEKNKTAMIITWAITGFLNDAAWQYDVSTVTGGSSNSTLQNDRTVLYNAEIIHQRTIPSEIKHNPASWWWRYDFIFYCYWGELNETGFNRNNESFGSPINDALTLDTIKNDLKKYLGEGLETLSVFDFHESSHGLLGMSQEDPRYSATPFIDSTVGGLPLTPAAGPDQNGTAPISSDEPSIPTKPDDQTLSKDSSKEEIEEFYRTPIDAHQWVSPCSFLLFRENIKF